MTANTKIHREQGGAKEIVESGGEMEFKSGGTLDMQSGSNIYLGDTTKLTSKTKELNTLDGAPMGAAFTIGDEDTNAINVGIQLNDGNGAALAVRGSVFAYLSDDENGDSIAATAPSGGWAIGTDGLLIPVVANKAAQLVSESDGDIDITITESSADTFYLVIVLANGKLAVSGAITFASE